MARTFSYEDKEIVCVRYCMPPPDDEAIHYQYATGNHPFWVKGLGWTRADLLENGAQLELQDGRTAYVLEVSRIYKADRPGIGWMPEYSHSADGFEIHFSGSREWWLDEEQQQNFGKSLGYLQTRIYNIEVKGFHTYYVGELGVWVHNANCVSIDLMMRGNGVRSDPNMPRFESEVDVNAAMFAGSRGLVVVRSGS